MKKKIPGKKAKPLTLAEFAALGGKARAASMTPQQRAESAKMAARKRWEANRLNKSEDS